MQPCGLHATLVIRELDLITELPPHTVHVYSGKCTGLHFAHGHAGIGPNCRGISYRLAVYWQITFFTSANGGQRKLSNIEMVGCICVSLYHFIDLCVARREFRPDSASATLLVLTDRWGEIRPISGCGTGAFQLSQSTPQLCLRAADGQSNKESQPGKHNGPKA